ncbi:MAG: prolyl oligopeptidase family serine peptidase [Candidatus Sericytochromatia bacterium]|nr:prolyl oligopeptidase family serine peptidase [Candidatus Sericytochromatia bacterium]
MTEVQTVPVMHLEVAHLLGDRCEILIPAQAQRLRPAVVFFHGHGMDETQLRTRTDLGWRANQRGWLAASALLGSRAHWGGSAALEAAGRLLSHLVTQHSADPQRLYLVGFSMGGGTALLAAINPLSLPYRAAAVASSQGFSDLRSLAQANPTLAGSILRAHPSLRRSSRTASHSLLKQAEGLRGIPVYLEHGLADLSVPPAQTQRLAERLSELDIPADVHLYPRRGHSERTIQTSAILDFFARTTPPL